MTDKTGVLFVCLGNICRSPLAEGIFLHQAREQGLLDLLHVDSCGTGDWHVGSPADPRSIDIARRHGIELPSRARQLDQAQDFERFRWIIAMDRSNRANLLRAGASSHAVHLMMAFSADYADTPEEAPDVPDPYYGGPEGFEEVYAMLTVACDGLLIRIRDGI